jgi:competence protein ComEA
MSNSKMVGAGFIVAVIMVVVCFSIFRNPATNPGIAVRRSETQALAQSGPAAAPAHLAPSSTRPQAPEASPSPASTATAANPDTPGDPPVTVKPDPEVVVHVAGAVKHPGVYHLHPGARNDDAVKAAGGLTGSANEASLNLAAPAIDGAQLYVKNLSEQPVGGATEDTAVPHSLGDPLAIPPASAHGSKANATAAAHSVAKPSKLKSPSEGKININTASSDELQRVSGIGPAMADKIIAYRQENHGFQSLDDLLQISGIGAKKFAKMAPCMKIR